MSSVLLGGPPAVTAATAEPPAIAPPGSAARPGGAPLQGTGWPGQEGPGRGNAVTVIAGVGVLLLAMGVGVLIGRSGGSSKSAVAAPQVISVATAPASATGSAATEAEFSDDWPAGTSGFTVQLQTLSQAGTQTSAVEAAKSAAGAKGAKDVGALKSEDFSSLKAGSYIVYSGVFHKQAEAKKAQAGLKQDFPQASVIKVSSAGAGSSGGASSGSKAGSTGVDASESTPAPPTVLQSPKKSTKGKSYEERSKNLPNVISTG